MEYYNESREAIWLQVSSRWVMSLQRSFRSLQANDVGHSWYSRRWRAKPVIFFFLIFTSLGLPRDVFFFDPYKHYATIVLTVWAQQSV